VVLAKNSYKDVENKIIPEIGSPTKGGGNPSHTPSAAQQCWHTSMLPFTHSLQFSHVAHLTHHLTVDL
jgi:hypothetical protein